MRATLLIFGLFQGCMSNGPVMPSNVGGTCSDNPEWRPFCLHLKLVGKCDFVDQDFIVKNCPCSCGLSPYSPRELTPEMSKNALCNDQPAEMCSLYKMGGFCDKAMAGVMAFKCPKTCFDCWDVPQRKPSYKECSPEWKGLCLHLKVVGKCGFADSDFVKENCDCACGDSAPPITPEDRHSARCEDKGDYCYFYKAGGFCDKELAGKMAHRCPKTCFDCWANDLGYPGSVTRSNPISTASPYPTATEPVYPIPSAAPITLHPPATTTANPIPYVYPIPTVASPAYPYPNNNYPATDSPSYPTSETDYPSTDVIANPTQRNGYPTPENENATPSNEHTTPGDEYITPIHEHPITGNEYPLTERPAYSTPISEDLPTQRSYPTPRNEYHRTEILIFSTPGNENQSTDSPDYTTPGNNHAFSENPSYPSQNPEYPTPITDHPPIESPAYPTSKTEYPSNVSSPTPGMTRPKNSPCAKKILAEFEMEQTSGSHY